MTLLSRLRAWLRPYPDAAELQAEMLRRIPLIREHRKNARDAAAAIKKLREDTYRACFDLCYFGEKK